MARGVGRETLALVRISTWEGSSMLEWRPRLIALIIVLVLIAVVTGVWESGPLNWEW
jgi:hypothetical protein